MAHTLKPPRVFVSNDGSMLVMVDDTPCEGEVYYRGPKAEDPLYTLAGSLTRANIQGKIINVKLKCYDPVRDEHLQMERVNDILTCNGLTFTLDRNVLINIEEAAPLPLTRETEYLSQMANGDLILVSRKKYCWQYDSFKLFIGPAGAPMREIAVKKVERFRDGGTTHVYTSEGTFTCPTPGANYQSRMWPDKYTAVTTQDIAKYDVFESPEGLAVINLRVL